jgi:hypothetical protein
VIIKTLFGTPLRVHFSSETWNLVLLDVAAGTWTKGEVLDAGDKDPKMISGKSQLVQVLARYKIAYFSG